MTQYGRGGTNADADLLWLSLFGAVTSLAVGARAGDQQRLCASGDDLITALVTWPCEIDDIVDRRGRCALSAAHHELTSSRATGL